MVCQALNFHWLLLHNLCRIFKNHFPHKVAGKSYLLENLTQPGFTKATGRTLVTSTIRNEMQLIAVTLDDSDDWEDHTNMLNYGFENFAKVNLISAGQYVCTAEINKKSTFAK